MKQKKNAAFKAKGEIDWWKSVQRKTSLIEKKNPGVIKMHSVIKSN